jgi:hypothetical protein
MKKTTFSIPKNFQILQDFSFTSAFSRHRLKSSSQGGAGIPPQRDFFSCFGKINIAFKIAAKCIGVCRERHREKMLKKEKGGMKNRFSSSESRNHWRKKLLCSFEGGNIFGGQEK